MRALSKVSVFSVVLLGCGVVAPASSFAATESPMGIEAVAPDGSGAKFSGVERLARGNTLYQLSGNLKTLCPDSSNDVRFKVAVTDTGGVTKRIFVRGSSLCSDAPVSVDKSRRFEGRISTIVVRLCAGADEGGRPMCTGYAYTIDYAPQP